MAHQAPGGGRTFDILDSLKNELESVARESTVVKAQCLEYERKIQGQLNEMASLQNMIAELERAQLKMKAQYEEEINRLRRLVPPEHAAAGQMGFSSASSLPSSSTALGSLLRSPSLSITTQGSGSAFSSAPGSSSLPPLVPGKRPGDAQGDTKAPLTGSSDSKDKRRRGIDGSATPASSSGAAAPSAAAAATGTGPSGASWAHWPGSWRVETSAGDWLVGSEANASMAMRVNLLHTFHHPSVVCCVAFSGDGRRVASGSNRHAQVFEAATGSRLHQLAHNDATPEADLYIRSVAFDPTGTTLATGAEDKLVKLWDLSSPQARLLHTLVGHELDIYSLQFSADGRYLVSGSGDNTAKLWDVEKGKCLLTLGTADGSSKDGVTSVAISADGRRLATGALDRLVRIWDLPTGECLERLESHSEPVYSVAFSPDQRTLASASLDKTVRLWDVSSSSGGSRARCRATFNGHTDFVLSVAFSPDGSMVVSGSKDRSVQLWEPRMAQPQLMLQGHRNSVISVAMSSARTLATGSGDCRARLWAVEPGSSPAGS